MINKFWKRLSFALVLAVVTSTGTAAQQSFPMVCRGGGGMTAQVSADGTIFLNFQPTAQGTSAAPPGPGQCGWLDRGFRTGEPPRLKVNGLQGIHYLVDNMVGGGSFFMHVFNDNAGSMQVTRLGP